MRGESGRAVFDATRRPPPATALGSYERALCCASWTHRLAKKQAARAAPYRHLTSTDSGLEAFSRDPTGGSLAALAGRPAARTKYPNQWFLSY